jgi:hypothetical protein
VRPRRLGVIPHAELDRGRIDKILDLDIDDIIIIQLVGFHSLTQANAVTTESHLDIIRISDLMPLAETKVEFL